MKLFLTLIFITSTLQILIAQELLSYGLTYGLDKTNTSSQYENYMSALSFPSNNLNSINTNNLKKPKYKGHKPSSRLNPRLLSPFGVYLYAGGPVLLGASIEYFISSGINLKAGGGWTGAFAGFEYHIVGFRNNPWTPYTGIFATYSYNGDYGVYIPIGFHYISKAGVSFGFDLALWIKNTLDTSNDEGKMHYEAFGSASIRIGYRF